MSRSEKNAGKVKEKLEAFIQSGSFYEAEQMYQTLFARLNVQKKFDECAELMLFGALQLLANQQVNSGAVLAQNLLDTYANAGGPCDAARSAAVLQIFAAFPTTSGKADDLTKAVDFMRAAIRWSLKAGPAPLGDCAFHHALARFHWRTQEDFALAQRHFTRADPQLATGENIAMLQSWMSDVAPAELDLLVARTVLQYLCAENLAGANAVFAATRAQTGAAHDSPPLNFCAFLLETCQRDAPPLFEMLRERYAPSLARDPQFTQYLDRIGKVFFHLKPQATGMQGLLGDLLGGSGGLD